MPEDKTFVVPQSVGGLPLAGEPPKSEKRRRLFDNPVKIIGWIIMSLIALIALAQLKGCSTQSDHDRMSGLEHIRGETSAIANVAAKNGTFYLDVNDREFIGMSVFGLPKLLTAHLESPPETWWEVMPDDDPSRIVRVYPCNWRNPPEWATTNFYKILNFNTLKVRISPGQAHTTGICRFNVADRN